MIAGEEDVAPALADHWQDVTAAFHDQDAHHLYVDPDEIDEALDERARIRLSSIDQDQPFAFRAQTADVAGARASRRPSPSSRSSRARATGRWWRSRAGARASASPTTSGG